MDNDALDPTGVLREALFEGCLAGRLGLASREAQLLMTDLGANGYVVVPRHLLDELLKTAEGVIYGGDMALQCEDAIAAVVEAVGPTESNQKESTAMIETAEQQIDRLATFIIESVPGEPSRSEGAVDTAIRLLSWAVGPTREDTK